MKLFFDMYPMYHSPLYEMLYQILISTKIEDALLFVKFTK
ncbi:hypothetical protein bmyco0003_22230 [Bacillus pseudomycoides]|nr:hypothetical protein bmyco0002_21770 [Bacillus pseudomycoides]EEM11049.1 hypothetical protein bmyco0003_22230 [Bacillus pseudomycoides]EEM16802.1 hypothetical protein bpmyx0001_22800 [Bacillus pseudomycoides DSM 12442]